jgi:hypothetical protein
MTLSTAAGHHGHSGIWHAITTHVTSGDIATIIAPIIAALVVAYFGVRAYNKQQADKRRDDRARLYAEALRAVEDYSEAPYRILRKDGSAEARREITQHISDIKSRISFYSGWLAIHAPEPVRLAYEAYVRAAQTEAGAQMTTAWRTRPTKRDRDVPIGSPLPRTATDVARQALLATMKADL